MIDPIDSAIELRAACRDNDTLRALQLLDAGADPLFNSASAILWSARHGNEILLDAFEPFFMGLQNTLLPQILQACTSQECFISFYNKWNGGLDDIQRFELVYSALKHKHEKNAHFLLDVLPPLTPIQQQEVLNRAADGNWSVFERIASQVQTPQPFVGTVGLLVRYNQLDLLQRILPFVVWSKVHHHEIMLAFSSSPEAYSVVRPFISQEAAHCELLLRWASQKDISTFVRAIKEVTDPGVQTNVLCGLLRLKKAEYVRVLLETTGYTTLSAHLQHKELSDEMLVYFEEQHNWRQQGVLMDATQEQSESAPARTLKL